MTIIIPLIIWALSQGFKFFHRSYKTGEFTLHNFLDYGGMPSTHSAIVSSLMTVVGIKEGIDSTIFGVTVIFASFIIHDALRLRSVVQEHSKMLNYLRDDFSKQERRLYPLTNERIGHKLSEVFAGIIVGIVGTIILTNFLGR